MKATLISVVCIYIILYFIGWINIFMPLLSLPLDFIVNIMDFSSLRQFIHMVFLDTKLLIFLDLQRAIWLSFGYTLFQLQIFMCCACFPERLGN